MAWVIWTVEVLFGLCMAVTALGYLYFIIGEHRVQGWLRKVRGKHC
jgi:hypothetical protein